MSIVAIVVVSMCLTLFAGDLMNKLRGWANLIWIILLSGGLYFQIAAIDKVHNKPTAIAEQCMEMLDKSLEREAGRD